MTPVLTGRQWFLLWCVLFVIVWCLLSLAHIP